MKEATAPGMDISGTQTQQRNEWLRWLQLQRFTHFVTLTCPITPGSVCGVLRVDPALSVWRRLLRELSGTLDFYFLRLGKHYYKRPAEERVFFVAFPEQMTTNLHFHLLLRFPADDFREMVLRRRLSLAWKRICGVPEADLEEEYVSAHCERLSGEDTVVSYALKEGWNEAVLENILFSSAFHPRHRTVPARG